MYKKGFKGGKLAALTLAMGLMLAGCGSSGATGSTSAQTGTTASGTGNTTITPEKPEYNSGIKNLSEGAQKLDIPDTEMKTAHGSALSSSGVALLQKTVELGGDANANYLISPASIQMALGMTATGAKTGSETEKKMLEVLLPGENADKNSLNQEMATFAKRMRESEGVSWNVANSIWVCDDGLVKLRDSFISDNVNYYNSELYQAPFDKSTADAINEWVNKNTKEMIPKIIEELIPDAKIALINALAFEGEWANPYMDTDIIEKMTFNNSDGTKADVPFLWSEEHGVINLAGGIGFKKYYSGYDYSFVGILPPEGMSAEDYLKSILSGDESFAEAYLNAEGHDVYVKMPEFKAEYGTCMDDILKDLGMGVAYMIGGNPQFDEMVTDDSERVGIGTVIHKALIDVNRKGTKAAAATIVEIQTESAIEVEEPVYITLDRPFVYAIVDNTTGVPLFLGVENSIK